MKKQLIPIILLTLLFLGIIWIVWTKKPKVIVETKIKENIEKIDSLKNLISQDSALIDSLQSVKSEVIEKVIVKIEEQKTISPDSAVLLFGENIKKYGELGSGTPELREDSSVICSVDNIRDANIITTKLEGAYEENQLLSEMFGIQSGILEKKDSIIEQNSIILRKTETAYQGKIEELRKDLKKETRRRKAVTVGGGILVAVLAGLLIVK